MQNFIFFNDTKYVFGKGQIARLSELVPPKTKLLVVYGGGSVKKNGVYDQVKAALKGFEYTEFWGVHSNPDVDTVRSAAAEGLLFGAQMVLGVGGGSVADAVKFIAAAIADPFADIWDMAKGAKAKQVPFACVMTMPATGSEMNNGAVLSNNATKEKLGTFRGDYPRFSIVDPEVVRSVPLYQRANALADAYVHVLEQYVTTPGQNRILDRWAEGVLSSLREISADAMKEDPTYDTLCDYAYAMTMALNNFLRMGITQDWATHQIGHQITAYAGVTHGESLTMVWSALADTLRGQKHAKLLQYAERVLNIRAKDEPDEEKRIDAALKETDAWFKSLGLATSLKEKGLGMDVVDFVEKRFNDYGAHYGEGKNVDGAMARKILLKRL